MEFPNPEFQNPNKLQTINSQIYLEAFLWFDFISFGPWSIEYYLEIGACLPALDGEFGN
jgi:hypothetical protein